MHECDGFWYLVIFRVVTVLVCHLMDPSMPVVQALITDCLMTAMVTQHLKTSQEQPIEYLEGIRPTENGFARKEMMDAGPPTTGAL